MLRNFTKIEKKTTNSKNKQNNYKFLFIVIFQKKKRLIPMKLSSLGI